MNPSHIALGLILISFGFAMLAFLLRP